jgi:hypothetical protein
MKLSIQAVIAAFWLVFWTAQMMVNYNYYIRTENGRLMLLLFGICLALGAIFFAYIAWKSYGPKIMYKANKSKRCPDCYAKLDPKSDFCPKCGKDLSGRDKANICWNCGYEDLDKNSTSCPKCGREYKK